MYHNLVESLSEESDQFVHLLDKIEAAGYKMKDGDRDLLTDEDVEEAMILFEFDGPEAAVDYLETMFGFLFTEGE